jgi:hypothetical protein
MRRCPVVLPGHPGLYRALDLGQSPRTVWAGRSAAGCSVSPVVPAAKPAAPGFVTAGPEEWTGGSTCLPAG